MQREVGVLGLPITLPGQSEILQLWLMQEAAHAPGLLWSPVVVDLSQGPSKAYAGMGPGRN